MEFEEGYPPEVNSGNMYAGPGSDSLRRAAAMWRLLGQEMMALQEAFDRVLLGLMDGWSGPAATQVMEAAKPFAKWLADLSDQLLETVEPIAAIVWAYDYAVDGVVDPEQIDRNRNRQQWLINNNTFGRYDAEIADVEEEYQGWWEYDGTVMRHYRELVSDALSRLAPWRPPPSIANKTGLVRPALPSSPLSPEPLRTT